MDASSSSDVADVALDEVIVTPLLHRRPARASRHELENAALHRLASTFAEHPADMAQRLVEEALAVTGAGSAGLSLEEPGEAPVFRWVATAGEYARYVQGTLPRHFSPCGAVLDRGEPLLMQSPERHFPYIAALHAPVREVLLVPFGLGGVQAGTLWVVHHLPDRTFDAEDLRLVRSLAGFAAAAVATLRHVDGLRDDDARKDAFLAVVAHEMRNPLAPIQLSVQLLRRQIDDPSHRRSLELIERQAHRLGRLVDDLLDAARIRTGKVALDRRPVSLQEVVARALEACQPQLDAGRHALTVDLPDAPLTVDADVDRLAQVMINLLDNALKYTAPGGLVAVRGIARDGWAQLDVTDTGQGIAPDVLPQVFDLFVQGPAATPRDRGGLGIGLALARQLVTLHGGRLDAHSDGPGTGSRFTVHLPLIPAA